MARPPFDPFAAALEVRQGRKKIVDFPEKQRPAIRGAFKKEGKLRVLQNAQTQPTDRFNRPKTQRMFHVG